MAWSIPDWASVTGWVLTVGSITVNITQHVRRKISDNQTHRFLVGLKPSLSPDAQLAINDELERLKPSSGDKLRATGIIPPQAAVIGESLSQSKNFKP